MEGVLFIVIFFGGGMLWLLSRTEIGHAIADRIRGTALNRPDPVVLEELERLRGEVSELHERVDFAERMLAGQRVERPLGSGSD